LKRVVAEVIGPNPPCQRCISLKANVEVAAEVLKAEGIEVEIKRLDIMSKEVLSKYGLLLSPALAVNGTVKTMGWVPDNATIEKILKESVK